MFVDEVCIEVRAGNGGAGMVSFRREKFIPHGGPNGGDGGAGGHVYLVASSNINTLAAYRYARCHFAKNGESGRSRDCHGAAGDSIHLVVPVGTVVYDQDTGEHLIDLTEDKASVVVARGGDGGFGNVHFKSSTNRVPRRSTPGIPGECRRLRLELKLLADVGLLGLPNAGKSTLLSVISAARPKIADYPFTTLKPSLGVVESIYGAQCVVADIPGLIEGASQGIGLGHRFLRHVTRTNLLLHLIALPSSSDDLSERLREVRSAFEVISEEMRLYDDSLLDKPRWLIFNKADLYGFNPDELSPFESLLSDLNISRYFFISALTGQGCDQLKEALLNYKVEEQED